jgi:hypothetical protein
MGVGSWELGSSTYLGYAMPKARCERQQSELITNRWEWVSDRGRN